MMKMLEMITLLNLHILTEIIAAVLKLQIKVEQRKQNQAAL